ncbi:MAG: hypothetical protein JST64_05545 [Actinobacteria bacterium]|nr:hypothetical protein [Actinomycetota bacterium]
MRTDRKFRRTPLAAAVLLAAVLVPACAPGPTTYKEGRCSGTEGVSVVVDFAPLQDRIVQRCALGPQANGTAALSAVGLTPDSGPVTGGVCQIDGLPTQGYPYCWTTGGYWSYWKAPSVGAAWGFSPAGPASSAPAAGSVEGWHFALFANGTATPPRVGA